MGDRPDWLEARAEDNQGRAETACAAVLRHFAVEHGLFAEEIPPTPKTKPYSYNWPFGALWTAVLAVAALPGAAGEGAREALPALRQAARAYWDERPGRVPGYSSYVVAAGGGDRFYDDNVWMGLNHLRDARLGGGDAAMAQAQKTWEFVWSGWDEQLGGGIYWCEQKPVSKNTCCSGPAAVLALLLYEATGETDYLKRAQELYRWTAHTLADPADGLYWDNIRVEGGTIEKTKWSYNTGTPIAAGVLLHRHTGQSSYLAEASASASKAVQHFAPDGLYSDTPWFHSVLFRGLILLATAVGDHAHLRAVQRSVDQAWERARDDRNLVYPDWRHGNGVGGQLTLLNAAPFAEVVALLATLDGR